MIYHLGVRRHERVDVLGLAPEVHVVDAACPGGPNAQKTAHLTARFETCAFLRVKSQMYD